MAKYAASECGPSPPTGPGCHEVGFLCAAEAGHKYFLYPQLVVPGLDSLADRAVLPVAAADPGEGAGQGHAAEGQAAGEEA